MKIRLYLSLCIFVSGVVSAQNKHYSEAIFAGGCFWCMEPPYDEQEGVIKTEAGYAGGKVQNPTYEQVSGGRTLHREVVRVTYDPEKITYEKLLDIFWRNVDPTDERGQFCDRGRQYTTAIYATTKTQQQSAQLSKQKLIDSKKIKRVKTPIYLSADFYLAEDYHQNYYKKNPVRYKIYRYSCGRDKRLKMLWGAR